MSITFVQASSPGAYVSASSQASAFGSNNTAGNCLILTVVATSPSSPTVTDAAGNTGWQLIQDITYSGTTHVQSWVCFNCIAGEKTVTYHGGTGCTLVSIAAIAEIS